MSSDMMQKSSRRRAGVNQAASTRTEPSPAMVALCYPFSRVN